MTTYHNPEVLPAVKVIPDPGDTITKFNRYYLCINPNPALGPPTWRVSDPDEYPCDDLACDTYDEIIGVNPIISEREEQNYTLTFSISSLESPPTTFSNNRTFALVINPPQATLRGANHCSFDEILTAEPLISTLTGNNLNLSFSAFGLDPLPDPNDPDGQQVSYTSNTAVETITADLPVKSETIGVETTVSFDIFNLQPLP